MNRSKEPVVSVIIPVYNTEKYVSECISSVKLQTASNFQCIVIDDGSQDDSARVSRGAIGDDARFEFIAQANAGHSAARNRGLEVARGKYVIFLDSDDSLPPAALRTLLDAALQRDADIVTGIAQSFRGDRTWLNPQMRELSGVAGHYESIRQVPELARDASPCNKIIRRSIIVDNGLEFPLGVPVREDLHFVLRAYVAAKSITVTDTVVYNYRLRDDGDAPSHTQIVDDAVLLGLLRVHRDLTSSITQDDLAAVVSAMSSGILGNVAYRLGPYLRGQPNPEVVRDVAQFVASLSPLVVDALPSAEDKVLCSLFAQDRVKLAEEFAVDGMTHGFLGRCMLEDALSDPLLAKSIIMYQQRWIERIRRTSSGRSLTIREELRRRTADGARRLFGTLPKRNVVGREAKLAIARAQALAEPKPKRPIWVIGERRGMSAEDTGYHFFKHMRSTHPEVDCYFVTKPDAKCVEDVRQLGNVLTFGSVESFRTVMLADVLCYSDSGKDLVHKWERIVPHLSDHVLGCFLQHGVIGLHGMRGYYDREAMLKRGERVDMFVVSSEREAQIVGERLGHPRENVAVTGLSRFDGLSVGPAPTRSILFMPTWRPWLKGASASAIFDSEYFKEVQGFISSRELDEFLCRYDMTMDVCQHFAMAGGVGSVFRSRTSRVRIVDTSSVRLQDLIRSCAVMVSDYSSVTHDFAYQGRPVIYWMFDRSSFYRESLPILSPEDDLPGPVVSSQAEVLEQLERVAKNRFQVDPNLARRTDELFAHRDGAACERIFQELSRRSQSHHG